VGVGLELDARPGSAVVPSVRIDTWSFGIMCTGFGPCPSNVTTYSAGVRLRAVEATGLMPYAGGDVGYMTWNSDAVGWSPRVRAGADVRLAGPLGVNLEGAHSWFRQTSGPERGMYRENLFGITTGLRLAF
jgi:hypothetical protein